eukprot:tig00000949_g5717.t1
MNARGAVHVQHIAGAPAPACAAPLATGGDSGARSAGSSGLSSLESDLGRNWSPLSAVGHVFSSGLLFLLRDSIKGSGEKRSPSLLTDEQANADSRRESERRQSRALSLCASMDADGSSEDYYSMSEDDESDAAPKSPPAPLNSVPLNAAPAFTLTVAAPAEEEAEAECARGGSRSRRPSSVAPASGSLAPSSRRASLEPPRSGGLLHPRSGPLLPTARAREIRIERAAFEFPGGGFALGEVDVVLPPGSIMTVSGPPGAGKSTLLGILTGIIRPTRGRVTFDGRPIDRIPEAEWSEHVRFATEAAPVFNGTVRENIDFGQNVSLEDVRRAARIARIDEEIEAMERGYDTAIDNTLPLHQRQRIALARSLAARPALVVLDEALSAVDGETNQRINGMLHEAARETTIVRATRRLFLSTTFSSDVVVVLDAAGRLLEAAPPALLSTPRIAPRK